MADSLIYDVECELDPDIVADYDAWLPGHVRDVLACPGFLGAAIESPETSPGERERRRIRYRVENAAALDHYLENNATRLRTETAERFGGRVHCQRRVFRPRHELMPPANEPRRCLNCGTMVSGKHCPQCGQSGDVHVLSLREVAGDVTHSLLHLDSRVWRTIRLLVRRPGELTREFIAGRHQLYIPPFRLYLAVSVLFFALQALLPDDKAVLAVSGSAPAESAGEDVRKDLAAEGIVTSKDGKSLVSGSDCRITLFDSNGESSFEQSLSRACKQMRADGGKQFAEHFASTAPKLMFVFLPLVAAVALLFYWRPRRLYAEHLVLFLHNHAFAFLLFAVASIFASVGDLGLPLGGLFGFFAFLLFCWLPFYVFRSMRVVYGDGRFLTLLKFFAISTIYVVLLAITMLAGLVFAMYQLS